MPRLLLLLLCTFGGSLPSLGLDREAGCEPVQVLADVEVNEGKFSLADLLSSATCPELRRLASLVPLGQAPLPGSSRVFTGEQIRERFESGLPARDRDKGKEKAKDKVRTHAWARPLPDRITVRLAGERASCAELAESIGESSSSGLPTPAVQNSPKPGLQDSPPAASCGAGGRIRRQAPLAVSKTRWNASRNALEITAHCVQPSDCTPFLVSTPLDSVPAGLANRAPTGLPIPTQKTSLVVPGQRMTLLWDQDGIQMLLRVVCMDRGDAGEIVRARVQPGDRVLRATVVDARTLRVQL